MSSSIPLLDLQPEVDTLWDELNEAIQHVLQSGQFILGPEVRKFETAAADYLGVEHAIGVNSGTDALVIALRALGVERDDEVITTPFTFFATAEAISIIGAEPVFVDIDPRSFNLDPVAVEDAITEQTKAILPVHLFGGVAAMTQIMEIADAHDLKVLEDCAQSFGARYEGACVGCDGEHCDNTRRAEYTGKVTGAIGQAGAYSFFPTKNLGAYGDGGLIATDDDEVAETARMLRKHGGANKYLNQMLGYNSRLDAIQAAILRVKLPYVDEYNLARREIAKRYNEYLGDVEGIVTPEIPEGHVVHQYTIRVKGGKRDALADALGDREIASKVYYPVPCHRLPVYDMDIELPESERAAAEVLSLPIWPQAGAEVQERVADAIREVMR
jgi:dTDP-4-amino-4,6-dideoxygalactose transaminase